jgi:hypothetical protein
MTASVSTSKTTVHRWVCWLRSLSGQSYVVAINRKIRDTAGGFRTRFRTALATFFEGFGVGTDLLEVAFDLGRAPELASYSVDLNFISSHLHNRDRKRNKEL